MHWLFVNYVLPWVSGVLSVIKNLSELILVREIV